jgi:aconitase A
MGMTQVSDHGLNATYSPTVLPVTTQEVVDPYKPWTAEVAKIELPIVRHEVGTSIASIKAPGTSWVLIADVNFGASCTNGCAMMLRFKDCLAVMAVSFDPAFEQALKEQGILPLKFEQERDLHTITPSDHVRIMAADELFGKQDELLLCYCAFWVGIIPGPNRLRYIPTRHTLTFVQVSWYKAGSARKALSK